MNKQKLWTKDFLFVFFTNLFLYLSFYLLVVIFSAYAMEHFDATQSQAGLASSIFILGVLIARPFVGRFIQQLGHKRMLYIGLICGLVTSALYFQVDSLLLLLLNRFLHGISFGIAATATNTIVVGLIPPERRGQGIGYFALSITLAAAVGPLLGLFITQHGSYHMIFLVCLLFAAFSFVVTLFLKVPKAEPSTEPLAPKKGFKFKDFIEVKAVPIAIVMAVINFSYSSILTFLMAYAKDIDLLDAASFFFVVFAICILTSRPFTGRWFDLKGESFVMYPSLALFGVGLIFLSQSYQGFTLLLAGALIGLGFGTVQSSTQAIAVKNVPHHRAGLATSTFFILGDTGMAIGPYVLGLLLPITGYRGLYIAVAALVFASIVLYYVLHGRKTSPHNFVHKAS
ncbi:MFS transporter [Paenibacillus sp. IHBB 10380]|uniref:MFS transporter n=1 Tax=Paenibacillus sp. IHBB 10380 TaxID=1566358 RepID=UPI0005CFA71C|nr:MFS transporter [Paenibacillus sp. IHBB 10380]AJS60437.1 multidrug MFS transporter [Paenibacillus sp. IHBB 10380]